MERRFTWSDEISPWPSTEYLYFTEDGRCFHKFQNPKRGDEENYFYTLQTALDNVKTGFWKEITVMEEEQEQPRFAIRCAICLCVGFTELEYDPKWTCGTCGGSVELMGKVVQDKLEKEEWKAACDARCTHARGPKCDCRCKCKNHGSGKVIKVVIREEIPTIEFVSDKEALKRASEFRTEFALKTAKMTEEKNFYLRLKQSKLLDKAFSSRQHAARMKALGSI